MSLLTVISPAKKMDFNPKRSALTLTTPEFAVQANELIQQAQQWSAEDISRVMKLSDALAKLNYERYQSFNFTEGGENEKAALLAFQGDVYKGLDGQSLTDEQIFEANDRLRIISGLYGLLRPLDRIQPYRLEMGTRIDTNAGTTLYQYWGNSISDALNAQADKIGASHLINLASQEYFKAVPINALVVPVITCHFKEIRNGKPTIVSFNAKRARGLMVRFILTEGISNTEHLKNFDAEGYLFTPDLSDENNMTFLK